MDRKEFMALGLLSGTLMNKARYTLLPTRRQEMRGRKMILPLSLCKAFHTGGCYSFICDLLLRWKEEPTIGWRDHEKLNDEE
jgi:hypothetical protein